MADSDDRDDPTGYKNPPSWTRFQKGQSGNPKGRPPKKKATSDNPAGPSPLDDALRRELDRPIRVKDGTGSRELAMYEVIIRALTNAAAKGDVRAQREAIKLLRDLEGREAERQAEAEARRRRIFDNVVAHKKRQTQIWAAAAKAGGEPPDPWPHPDDILVDAATMNWQIRGPVRSSDVPFFEYCRAERDAWLAYFALDLSERKETDMNRRSLGELWMLWEAKLPLRWQLGERFEAVRNRLLCSSPRALRAHLEACQHRARELQPASFRGPMDKDNYRQINGAMKPLLKKIGYRSLAQFLSVHGPIE